MMTVFYVAYIGVLMSVITPERGVLFNRIAGLRLSIAPRAHCLATASEV